MPAPAPGDRIGASGATGYAIFRMAERHDMVLDQALVDDILKAIRTSRAIAVRTAIDLKMCFEAGAVCTHLQPGGTERWSVAIGGRWIPMIMDGMWIVTVLRRADQVQIERSRARRRAHKERDSEDIAA